MADVVDEMIAVRRATLALVDSLDESTMSNVGLANNNSGVRARDLLDHGGAHQASPRHPSRALRRRSI